MCNAFAQNCFGSANLILCSVECFRQMEELLIIFPFKVDDEGLFLELVYFQINWKLLQKVGLSGL